MERRKRTRIRLWLLFWPLAIRHRAIHPAEAGGDTLRALWNDYTAPVVPQRDPCQDALVLADHQIRQCNG